MLRTTIDKAYIKRTIRPLYGWSQATPSDMKLDPDYDGGVDVYPGMVFKRTAGQMVAPVSAQGDLPYGLSGLYLGGEGIDEVADQGVNSIGVWVLAPDAQFEVLAPAFDTDASWDDTGEVLVHAHATGDKQGKLAPAGADGTLTTAPVARLIEVLSDHAIIIGGLAVRP